MEDTTMFFRKKVSGKHEYLQIVENFRDERGKTRQRVLVTLGNLSKLRKKGRVESLLESGARFSEKLAILSAYRAGKVRPVSCIRIGADAIFGRLWKESGVVEEILNCVRGRRYGFDIERAIYHTVLQRLFESGSDRSSFVRRRDFRLRGTEDLELHQIYRAMGFLGEATKDQGNRTRFRCRCNKDEIEEGIFFRRRDLFTESEVVFFDTTSIYFEGEGGESTGEYGNSKDHRCDRKQMVVGVVVDERGIPLCCEMWPGNTADVLSLKEVVKRFESSFKIKNICIVADRGMISKDVINFLESEESSFSYILGVRMRNVKSVREDVLSRGGRYHVVDSGSRGLKVKEVMHEGRRYIVCLNELQAKRESSEREAIIESLQLKLRRGDKCLIGNKGYRKYLKCKDGNHFCIDSEKIKEEKRYDGKWVLTTNRDDICAEDVARQYKLLWMVENVFRTMKSTLETRPIYHKTDESIRGHVFCSFLALLLRREPEHRLEEKWGTVPEWNNILHDIAAVEEVTAEISGKKIIFRSELKGWAGKIFQAVGVAVPPAVRFVQT